LEDIAQQDIVVDQEPRANVVQWNEHDRTPASTPAVVTVAAPVTVPAPVTTGFHIGQRVFITNRITHVLVQCAMEADRTAIVTHFTATRIAIRTINGYHTHQHPKNLGPCFVTMSSGSSSPPPPPATSSGQASGGTSNNNNNNNDNSNGNARYCGSRNQRGGRGNNNNNNNSTTRGPFKGKATDLHGFIYDIGLPNSNNDLFSKTTKEIAEHVSRTIEGAGDFRLAMVDLTFPTLVLPSTPVNELGTTEPSWVNKKQYKLEYSEYVKKKNK
jgi:hypothetical protein